MITYKQAQTDAELNQILVLQQQNLPKNLPESEQLKEGFLTVEHNFELLKKMNEAFPHTIAKDGEQVVGYALSMHPGFEDEVEILKPMIHQINTIVDKTSSYIIMGQICVAKTHRGKGVFRGLYQNMQKFTSGSFESIITGVNKKNTRSIKAHSAIGFKELSYYKSNGKEWALIVLK